MPLTSESKGPLKIPSNLPTNVLSWTEAHVILFIETNLALYHNLYSHETMPIRSAINVNRINGRGLLKLTVEQMVDKLDLKIGVALSLEDMFADLKKLLSPLNEGESLPQYREGND